MKLSIKRRRARPDEGLPPSAPSPNVIPLRDPVALLTLRNNAIDDARAVFARVVKQVTSDMSGGFMSPDEAERIIAQADADYSLAITQARAHYRKQCPTYSSHEPNQG